ncbi:putative cation-transporting ATPase [Gordonia hirsuta DSM 44140 = NBRC 16056]|uniref:Putative cation-transporting ATPase n=1 Tax=Gordonia hirsuta DSM 44140 = NBRC 16056 TaxID=1121927 RepID=L7L7J1_9ACTN|nr:heavy metal translocating P-type ATPase [Gordonia hirsuta]GAC57120.1 putative cation-transporting ATPase [Gordonia hirsuta DSM 44140 = NBRC 16056]
MWKVWAQLRGYPLVVATVVVGIVGLVLLATPAGRYAGQIVGFYALAVAAWTALDMLRQLIRGRPGLDLLAVTAIIAAVLVGEPWAALVVVLMLTGGAALEEFAENRSKRELTTLLRKAPQQATRLIGDGAEQETETVSVDAVARGDRLLVRPGELVPVDAVLLHAPAVFDESSLTGEPLPVERVAGERVPSGAVNGTTAITMRAVAAARDSQYQQIVALVEQATGSRARVVRLADRYALPFTVASLAIAALAWALSGEAVRFAEVLVVATPCPLLIAAPVAFLGGMSRAARYGLIVKGGSTLEQLSRVRSAALDKTGTLTTGHPDLQQLHPGPGFTDDDLLQLAASAEVYSSHVLASSVVTAARRRGLALREVDTATEWATNGVSAELADGAGIVRVGKPAWLAGFVDDLVRTPLEPGELAIYVGLDDCAVGVIVMRDTVRPEAAAAIADLRALGIVRTLVVTGDVAATAEPIAERLGIDEVYSSCGPADKVDIVAQVRPRPLLMVGDGLNDAPVLAAADIGFAMGARGSTAASESADVVNRYDTLLGLPRAVRIGQDTVRIALQSIWAGIAISAGLMVIAAFGLLPALAGAWLQEVVDLVAILGALRAMGPRSERRQKAVTAPVHAGMPGAPDRSAG